MNKKQLDKQLDDLEAEEENSLSDSDIQKYSEDDLEDDEAEELEAGSLSESELPDELDELDEQDGQREFDAVSKEKADDVNDILDSNKVRSKTNKGLKESKTETEEKEGKKQQEKESGSNAWENNDCNNNDCNKDAKPGSAWKYISGILLVLLVAAVYTNGFNFTGASTASALTLIDAEEKVLDYVNSNLLQPPYTATVKSSEELGSLFKITLVVTGREIDSYLTKDGKFFFPQGFDLEAPLDVGAPGTSPEAELVEVSIDDDPVLGDEDAPVTIVEFSDFQCPYCKGGWETMKQVEKEYVKSGKVKIVFRDFPLGFHAQAKPAAMAAECAYEQGKFWEYHDLLFGNQDGLNPGNYKQWAALLGLDTQQFNECLDSEKYKEEVEKDFADGQSYGVSGTPAFFVNGKLISGAQPFTAFKQVIEEALKTPGESQETEELEEQIDEVADTVEEETAEPVVETQEPAVEEVKEIQIAAKKWRFDPNYLEINQGDKVKLVIASEELDLKFILSAFSISEEVAAGESVAVEFTADKKGTFEFFCGDYCVNKYGVVQGSALKGELVVS